MKFISIQNNLKKGLNIVGNATTKNINLPILNNILIKASAGKIEFTRTNLEIGIHCVINGKVEEEGEFTVNSRLINDYINLLNTEDKVEIEKKAKELRIKSANYKTVIKGEEAKEFPLIPTINDTLTLELDVFELKDSLTQVLFSAASSENRIELSGVLFNIKEKQLYLASTDSYRLAEKKVSIKNIKNGEKIEKDIIVPAKTISELLRILNSSNLTEEKDDNIEVKISDNQILFNFNSISLISRLINGRYPDYEQIIPKNNKTKAIIDKNELIRAVKAVSLFSKTGINDITINFYKNKTQLSSFSGATGESLVELSNKLEGEENEITVNYRYLLDGLSNLDGDRVIIEILSNNTPCLVKSEKSDDFIYIIMPIKQ